MSAIDYLYDYSFASTIDDVGLHLATCGGDAIDLFFQGKLRRAPLVGTLLTALASIVRTHFFDARKMNRDPIVTTSPTIIRWEGFSGCCGAYARIDLDDRAFVSHKMRSGTTNVDFNESMINHLSRLGMKQEVALSISTEDVTFREGEEQSTEHRVKLPIRWIKGLSEVQVYQSKLQLSFSVNAASLMRFLQTVKATKFNVQHLIPSGDGVRLSARAQVGSVPIGAIERLRVLLPVLAHAQQVHIWCDKQSGVSGWQIPTDVGNFWYVLSPELSRGFSGEGQLLTTLSSATSSIGTERVMAALRAQSSCEPAELASQLGIQIEEVRQHLMILSTSGLAGFDVGSGHYFHRELPFSLEKIDSQQPRLKGARKLLAENRVSLHAQRDHEIELLVQGDSVAYFVRLGESGDRCNCQWFNRYQGQRGSCKHILAATMYMQQDPQAST